MFFILERRRGGITNVILMIHPFSASSFSKYVQGITSTFRRSVSLHSSEFFKHWSNGALQSQQGLSNTAEKVDSSLTVEVKSCQHKDTILIYIAYRLMYWMQSISFSFWNPVYPALWSWALKYNGYSKHNTTAINICQRTWVQHPLSQNNPPLSTNTP